MAGKKSKSSGKVSLGGRQKANLHREEKRQAKFAQKRENGTAYKYEPNRYEKGTDEWYEETVSRIEKAKDKKLPLARWTSIMAKLDNQLTRERLLDKEKELKRKRKANQ